MDRQTLTICQQERGGCTRQEQLGRVREGARLGRQRVLDVSMGWPRYARPWCWNALPAKP